ncbi:hypothetical protein [Alteromonas sp. ASW11-130]|uniref:hypothetical protein n=1 Tax=Alteromonas sp. ASW11-130 TaxID=3015775 RepID=UPI0022427787|nr:hypothetical protein [Alteromonas sp. ASW11-130]MCW8090822.1 hypothetical protein [Alteromonas sp. ASW11-130]
MKRVSVTFLFLIICTLLKPVHGAQCEQDEYNDFDFWLGVWVVTTPDGNSAGNNTIQKDYDNCVITEHYETKDGPYGMSINIYDKTTGKWYQTWVDKTGLRLQLAGGLHNNAMILYGKRKTKEGKMIDHKISWTPQQNGSVIQHWEMRKVDNGSWRTLFKGIYTNSSLSSKNLHVN